MSFKSVHNFTEDDIKHHDMSIVTTTYNVFISANSTSAQQTNAM